MRLRRLTLRHVRGVEERTVDLVDGEDTTGVVVIEGGNEAGKSTLGDALDVLLAYKSSSRAADVVSLQTVGRDEAPEVEAELQIGPDRVVYRKRFLRRPSTELEWITPHRKALSGDAAHERVEQLLAEQIDVGLWSSLRLRQDSGLEQAGVGSAQGLAAALEQRSGGSAIGDAELAILEAVRSEHARYRTPKGKATGVLREAERAAAAAHADLDAVTEQLTRLRGDIDEVDRLEQSLPDLERQARETAARGQELTARLAEVEQLARTVAERERDADAAEAAVALLAEQHRARTALVDELAGAEAASAEVAGTRRAAEQALRDAAERLTAATESAAEATARLRAARAARQEAQGDLDHLADRIELEALRRRVAEATAARERLREVEAQIAANPVDRPALDALRDAAAAVDRTRAVLDAASPELRVTADRDLTVGEGGASIDLRSGDVREWTVRGVLRLQLGDVGEVEVSAGNGAEQATAAHRDAVTALTDALADVGAEDLAAAELSHRRRVEAEQRATQAAGDLAVALAGTPLEDLTGQVDRLERAAAGRSGDRAEAPVPSDLDAARELLDRARAEEQAAEAAVDEPTAAVERARAAHEARSGEVIEARTRFEELARRVETLTAALEEARRVEPDEKLALALADARDRHGEARAALEDALEALAAVEPETIRTLAGNAEDVAEDARRRRDEARQRLREARTAVAVRGGEGLHEQREEAAAVVAAATENLRAVQRRAAAAELLLTTLERHRAAARERYAAPLRAELLAYGRILHGAGFDVELDEDLRVARRTLDGVTLDVSQLSVGAQEQLALLGRLACARLLADRGGLLLFDDALGNTDPERLEAIGAVLRLAGEHCQVLVLTCYPERYRHVGGARRIVLS